MIQSKLRWYHGLLAIALFGAVMALEYFGLLGKHTYATVIGEGLIALVAIGVVLIARENLSAVFTFKKVRWVQIAGLYLMWRGVLSAEMVLSEVLMHFFPKLMRETSGIEEWMHRVPFALAFFVIAVIPAVCEEMLFRGTLLHSMKDLKKPWLIIILNGLVFGIAHLSSIKLVSVSLLGILFAYVVYQSGNLACSMILHCLNNGWVVIYSFALSGLNQSAGYEAGASAAKGLNSMPVGVIGVTLCTAALSPMLIYIGHNLFMRPPGNGQLPPGQKVTLKRDWLFLTGALAFLIFALGLLLFAIGFEEIFHIGLQNLT